MALEAMIVLVPSKHRDAWLWVWARSITMTTRRMVKLLSSDKKGVPLLQTQPLFRLCHTHFLRIQGYTHWFHQLLWPIKNQYGDKNLSVLLIKHGTDAEVVYNSINLDFCWAIFLVSVCVMLMYMRGWRGACTFQICLVIPLPPPPPC